MEEFDELFSRRRAVAIALCFDGLETDCRVSIVLYPVPCALLLLDLNAVIFNHFLRPSSLLLRGL